MKRHLPMIAVGIAVALASATASGTVPPRVQGAVDGVMQQYGIPLNSGSRAIYETGGSVSDDRDIQGYIAWIEMPGDEPGYLVVETRPNGSIKQVYTRFGAQIPGVPAY